MSNDFNRFIRLYGKAFRGTLHPVCELVAAFSLRRYAYLLFSITFGISRSSAVSIGAFIVTYADSDATAAVPAAIPAAVTIFFCILFHTTTSFLLRDIFSAPIKTDAPPDSDHSQQIPEEAGEES